MLVTSATWASPKDKLLRDGVIISYHVPPNGIKNLVVLVDSVFQKQLLYEAEELAEPTRAHLWNKGSEIRSNLCTVVSYETHCYI